MSPKIDLTPDEFKMLINQIEHEIESEWVDNIHQAWPSKKEMKKISKREKLRDELLRKLKEKLG